MLAYGIIFLALTVLGGIGQMYSVKNSIYLHKHGINDHYDLSKHNQDKD